MTNSLLGSNPNRMVRMAGLFYMLLVVIGPFSIMYMPETVFHFGDAAANAASMIENEGLVRLGILGDLAIIVLEIFITSILFVLFKPVSEIGAAVAGFARIGMAVIMVLNLTNYLVPLHILGQADYLGAFTSEQTAGLALMFIQMHEVGVYAWQIFFAVHLLAIGFLVLKSRFFPRLIGLALFVGSFGYALQSLEKFILPGNEPLILVTNGLLIVVSVAELAFGLWMLIRGLNLKNWEMGGRLEAA